jgi:6-phosphogluconolactonase
MTLSINSIARALLLLLGTFSLPFAASAQNDSPGAVYTITNAVGANRVVAFARDAHGQLQPNGTFPTGGSGTGASLGSQGALALTADGRWLLVVNAGSNQLSVFSVRHDTLVLTDVVGSGGMRPISVTVEDNLVYVLNAGGAVGASDNISGFYLTEKGQLHAVPNSTRPLSAANVGPAQVSFGLRGDVLLVTEKATALIDGFAVNDEGVAGSATITPSSGPTPFGFAISSKGYAFVSEAPGSALSSYAIEATGAVDVVTPSLANHQAAACWVVLSKNEKYAYTANAANNTISGYGIDQDGSLTLLGDNGLTAVTDSGPLDLAVSNNGRFLYSLNSRSGSIVGFTVGEDGSLTRIGSVGGLPAGVAGLVAR